MAPDVDRKTEGYKRCRVEEDDGVAKRDTEGIRLAVEYENSEAQQQRPQSWCRDPLMAETDDPERLVRRGVMAAEEGQGQR